MAAAAARGEREGGPDLAGAAVAESADDTDHSGRGAKGGAPKTRSKRLLAKSVVHAAAAAGLERGKEEDAMPLAASRPCRAARMPAR